MKGLYDRIRKSTIITFYGDEGYVTFIRNSNGYWTLKDKVDKRYDNMKWTDGQLEDSVVSGEIEEIIYLKNKGGNKNVRNINMV